MSAGLAGSPGHRLSLAAAGVLIAVAFAPTLAEMVQEWILRPEYSHGFLMPLVAAWLLWERREEFARLEPRPSLLGALFLAPCLALLLLGEMKLSWFLKPYAFVGSLGALVWTFYGFRAVRLALPALVALLLMCPLPGRVQRDLTLPLKRSAALLATGMLDLSSIPASLEGNLVHLPGIESLWIADACSGIRSLISLGSLAVLSCFLWRRHWFLKAAVVAATVPIAVFVNGLRIWLTGFLSVKVSPEAAQGFFHHFEGIALFAAAALLLAGWALLLAAVFPARKP